jgi:hypothetical protein
MKMRYKALWLRIRASEARGGKPSATGCVSGGARPGVPENDQKSM